MLPKAPPLSGTDWLNIGDLAAAPLSFPRLRGRPVVLLFWTTTCEGSWVRLRQLERLASRHEGDVHVVAVHSPRFDFERSIETLQAAIDSRGIAIPVLHDPGLDTWARYGPAGRPTVVVLDHRLRVVGAMAGTDGRSIEALDQIVDEQVALAVAAGTSAHVDSGAVAPDRRATVRPLHQLHAPGSAARLLDGRVVIADRGSGRLLALEVAPDAPTAEVSAAFGGVSGVGHLAARLDGTLAASFPDRGEIETIDITGKVRTTLAKGLSRPAGVIEDRDGSLVAADAGGDQLIRVERERGGRIGPIAGTEREPLSQPLDVIRIDAGLMFCEASTGAIRLLTDGGKVQTVNDGTQPGLCDGPLHRAMFQRPTGLATLDDGSIAVADCGNDRVRIVRDRRVETVPVTGLCRPEAVLFLGGDRLLVCDTGNDRLVTIDLARHEAAELRLDGLPL